MIWKYGVGKTMNDKFHECTWCEDSKPKLMVSGVKIPMVCDNCGGGLGWETYDQAQRLIQKRIDLEHGRIINIIFQSKTLLDLEKVELCERIQGKI